MPREEFAPRAAVKKFLEDQRAEHVQHLFRALGSATPDLITFKRQADLFERIDEAVAWLEEGYPAKGFKGELPKKGLKIRLPKLPLPKLPKKSKPEAEEPTEAPAPE